MTGTRMAETGTRWAETAIGFAGRLPDDALALVARVAVAPVFWLSAQTKILSMPGFSLLGREVGIPASLPPVLAPLTVALFESEYQVPLLPPGLAAWMATTAELLLPLLLLLGLATRLSALGLLGMTVVIQVFVYPSLWSDHLLWAMPLLFLISRGPGRLSLDHLVRVRMGTGLRDGARPAPEQP